MSDYCKPQARWFWRVLSLILLASSPAFAEVTGRATVFDADTIVNDLVKEAGRE